MPYHSNMNVSKTNNAEKQLRGDKPKKKPKKTLKQLFDMKNNKNKNKNK